jgi:hypothetical protein
LLTKDRNTLSPSSRSTTATAPQRNHSRRTTARARSKASGGFQLSWAFFFREEAYAGTFRSSIFVKLAVMILLQSITTGEKSPSAAGGQEAHEILFSVLTEGWRIT